MKIVRRSIPIILSASIFYAGCGGDTAPKETPKSEQESAKKNKKNSGTSLFQVGDEVFSIPSPVQTALLIQKTGAPYNQALLSDPAKTPHHSTKFQRSVNLGIVGADLGYVTIYEQPQDGISYMNSARKLADELGISDAFDMDLMKRFEANMGNRDSLLSMVSEAYRSSDSFLKDNEREEVGVLILAGGWLEAIHFSTKILKESGNEDIKKRIGEQRSSLENLIKLLQRHTESEEIAEFSDQLIDLYYLYDEVESKYVFKEPETNPANKTTVINSETAITITDEQLTAISDKVESIRKKVIG